MVGWARKDGRRASRHPNTAQTPQHHPAPPQHPTSITLQHPSTTHPARMRKGNPQPQHPAGGCQKGGEGGRVQTQAPQTQPGGGCPRPALPKAAGDSRLAPAAPAERVFTRHHPAPSICFDPRAKYYRPRCKNRNHLGRS